MVLYAELVFGGDLLRTAFFCDFSYNFLLPLINKRYIWMDGALSNLV